MPAVRLPITLRSVLPRDCAGRFVVRNPPSVRSSCAASWAISVASSFANSVSRLFASCWANPEIVVRDVRNCSAISAEISPCNSCWRRMLSNSLRSLIKQATPSTSIRCRNTGNGHSQKALFPRRTFIFGFNFAALAAFAQNGVYFVGHADDSSTGPAVSSTGKTPAAANCVG